MRMRQLEIVHIETEKPQQVAGVTGYCIGLVDFENIEDPYYESLPVSLEAINEKKNFQPRFHLSDRGGIGTASQLLDLRERFIRQELR